MIKYLLTLLFLSISSLLIAQPAPDRVGMEAEFSDDGIWHKNMELICPVNNHIDSARQSNEMIEFTKINSNLGNQLFYIGAFNYLNNDPTKEYSYIRLDNVTNPRKPKFNFRRIYVENHGKPVILGPCATWDSGTDVYAVCTVYDDKEPDSLSVKALIFNLTALLESDEGSVIVTNIEDRSKTFDNEVNKNVFKDIYLGYIEEIEEYFINARCEKDRKGNRVVSKYVGPHTMSIDKKSSVLTFSHLSNSRYYDVPNFPKTDAFVDVIVLDGIPGNDDNYYGIENHPNHPNNNSLTNAPIKVSRLLKDGKPIRITKDTETSGIPADWPNTSAVHETHAHGIKKFDENGNPLMETEEGKISLALACASGIASTDFFAPRECFPLPNETEDNYIAQGGFAIVDVDFSDDPFDCVVTFQQWVKGDPDRQNPNVRDSPETFGQGTNDDWSRNLGHSIEPVHIDLKNHFFVSMQELAAPTLNILDNGDYFQDEFTPSFTPAVNGAYSSIDGSSPLNLNDGIFDDRRLSNNLKLWGGDRGHHFIRGIGSENQSNPSSSTWDENTSGPLSSYEVLEQSVADRNAGNFFPVQHIDEVQDIDCDPETNESRAPNSIHHVRTLNGSYGVLPAIEDFRLRSELFIGAYAGGARILDLKNFIRTDDISNDITLSKDTILEYAYFDFMPTLTYDPDDRYFYMTVGRDDFYHNDLAKQFDFKYSPQDIGIMNYYNGVFDLYPDSRRDSLEHDEDFVYALMGQNGKQAPFCQNGGYMIYRYFRDEIGGIISGNNPGSPTLYQDMVFRKVNLQGDFKVQRDVTIAEGAEVWLLPGEEGSGKTHDNMEFLVGDNGEKTVYVDGILHVSLSDGNDGGSHIGVDVPVIVREGGKLYIHKIRDGKDRIADMKKKITVQDGGLLEITEDAKVVLEDLFVDDGGQFIVKEGAEVTFDGMWHLNYGVAKYLGTISKPITISADIPVEDAIGLDFDEMQNYIQFYYFGNNIASGEEDEDEVYIEHTTFKGVHIRCHNKYITKVENNKFYDDSDEDYAYIYSSSIPVFFYSQFEAHLNSYGQYIFPIVSELNINNNIFKDFSISHMDSIKYLDGLVVQGNYDLTVEDNTFENHRFGANVRQTKKAIVNQNTFTNMLNGLSVSETGGRICDNTFNVNENAVVYNNTRAFAVYDNVLTTVYQGMKALDGLYQNYRNNTFTNYVIAIYEENASALLRGLYEPSLPICGATVPFTLLGRNKFNNGSVTILNNPYIDIQLDPKRSDVFLKHENANVYLDCGYNDLSKLSPHHIYYQKANYYDPDKSVDGNNNDWNDVGGHIPRGYDVSISGANLDQSETTVKSCDEKNACSCKLTIFTNGGCLDDYSFKFEDVGNWVRITSTVPAATYFDDKFDFYYSHVEDVALSEPCRKNFAINLLSTAVYGDSNTVKITIVNTLLSTMYVDTTYSVYERINLGYTLAEGFERVGEIDSAIKVLQFIKPLDIQTYNSRADWDIDRLKSLQFTDRDSIQHYNKQYLDKYSERLKLRSDTSGVILKSVNPSNEITLDKNELYENEPNPFTGATEISYYLTEEDNIKLTIISETGREIQTVFEGTQSKGLHSHNINLETLSSGVYFYTLKTSQGEMMKKMYLIK